MKRWFNFLFAKLLWPEDIEKAFRTKTIQLITMSIMSRFFPQFSGGKFPAECLSPCDTLRIFFMPFCRHLTQTPKTILEVKKSLGGYIWKKIV